MNIDNGSTDKLNQNNLPYYQYTSKFTTKQQPYQTSNQPVINFIVVSKDEIEAPWKQECAFLKSVIKELESTKQDNLRFSPSKDGSSSSESFKMMEQIEKLKQKNSDLENKLDKINQALRLKEDEVISLKKGSYSSGSFSNGDYLRTENEKLNNMLKIKLEECDQLRSQLYQVEMNKTSSLQFSPSKQRDQDAVINQNLQLEVEKWKKKYEEVDIIGLQERINNLSQDVETWKQRFLKANHDYNACQEQIILIQTELDQYKKGVKLNMMSSSRQYQHQQSGSLQDVDSMISTKPTFTSSQFSKQRFSPQKTQKIDEK